MLFSLLFVGFPTSNLNILLPTFKALIIPHVIPWFKLFYPLHCSFNLFILNFSRAGIAWHRVLKADNQYGGILYFCDVRWQINMVISCISAMFAG